MTFLYKFFYELNEGNFLWPSFVCPIALQQVPVWVGGGGEHLPVLYKVLDKNVSRVALIGDQISNIGEHRQLRFNYLIFNTLMFQ
jgi:hypothetical protein